MERLTRRMCGGWGVIPGYELNTVRGMRAVVDRLAAYENTGLSPNDIQELQQKNKELEHPLRHGCWSWFEGRNGNPSDGYDYDWGWECSECHTVLPDNFDNPDEPPKIPFCPHCGANMSGR